MKLLFVADNSTEQNWGCRATSFALRRMVASRHEITGTITRALLKSPLTVPRAGATRAHAELVRRLRRPRVGRTPVLGGLVFGAIDTLGVIHPPTHDSEADAALLWDLRDRSPKARAIVERIEACDGIVVNGEGEMIFSSPARPTLLQTLAICALAKQRGKPVFYLNGMISRAPDGTALSETVASAARVLDGAVVSVRDARSQATAVDLLPALKPAFHADALFTWYRQFAHAADDRYDPSALIAAFDRTGTPRPRPTDQPYLAISGSSLAARNQRAAADAYTLLAERLKTVGLPVLLVATCGGDDFLGVVARRTGLPFLPAATPILAGAAVMANARLLVSGRWHPSIMAALGGTPSVFLGSNSHKTFSLQELLDYPAPREFAAIPAAPDVETILAAARQTLAEGIDRRRAIAAAAARLDESARDMVGCIG
jgi:hypothetical protein